MESDFYIAISWVDSCVPKPWKLHFYFNEIKCLVFHLQVVFHHEVRPTNVMADCLAKQGVDGSVSWEVFL